MVVSITERWLSVPNNCLLNYNLERAMSQIVHLKKFSTKLLSLSFVIGTSNFSILHTVYLFFSG